MPNLTTPDRTPPTQDAPHPPPPAAGPPPCGSRLTLAGAPYADGSYTCNRVTGHAGVHHDSRSGATWPDVRPDPAPANPFADELRRILTDLQNDPNECHLDAGIGERLLRLTEHVERYAAIAPDGHTLDAAGLDPEQECRAQAARAIGWQHPDYRDDQDYRDRWWTELDQLATWIDTGARP